MSNIPKGFSVLCTVFWLVILFLTFPLYQWHWMTENLPVHRSARQIPTKIFSPAISPPHGHHGWSTRRREDAAGQVLDGGNTEKKHGLYSINCNSWWIHRMFVVSNNIVWISVRRPWKMKSNQLQSFPTIFIFLIKPVLSCPEAEKYLCVWCLSVFFNGDIYSI